MVARASHSCQQKQFDQSERCSVRDLGTRVESRNREPQNNPYSYALGFADKMFFKELYIL